MTGQTPKINPLMIESIKHLSIRAGVSALTQHYELLTHDDRPNKKGKLIKCPQCLSIERVKSFSFPEKICPNCMAVIPKHHWLLDQLRL